MLLCCIIPILAFDDYDDNDDNDDYNDGDDDDDDGGNDDKVIKPYIEHRYGGVFCLYSSMRGKKIG